MERNGPSLIETLRNDAGLGFSEFEEAATKLVYRGAFFRHKVRGRLVAGSFHPDMDMAAYMAGALYPDEAKALYLSLFTLGPVHAPADGMSAADRATAMRSLAKIGLVSGAAGAVAATDAGWATARKLSEVGRLPPLPKGAAAAVPRAEAMPTTRLRFRRPDPGETAFYLSMLAGGWMPERAVMTVAKRFPGPYFTVSKFEELVSEAMAAGRLEGGSGGGIRLTDKGREHAMDLLAAAGRRPRVLFGQMLKAAFEDMEERLAKSGVPKPADGASTGQAALERAIAAIANPESLEEARRQRRERRRSRWRGRGRH